MALRGKWHPSSPGNRGNQLFKFLPKTTHMKLLIRSVLFLFSLSTFISVNAQGDVPEYTVQIGNFVNPRPADFDGLRPTGFVYAVKRPTNHTDVFIGGYSSDEKAQRVAAQLKENGYGNAFVSKLNTEGGESVTVIQLATRKVGEKIEWDRYLEAGQLYVLLNGSQIKIMVGGFADVAAAKTNLPAIRKLGFDDAFVKKVNNALLHEIGEFETGGIAKKPLIPLDFTEKEAVAEAEAEEAMDARPTSYDDTPIVIGGGEKKPEMTAKGGTVKPAAPKAAPNQEAFSFKAKVPEIRANVKRTSAIELQKVLKAEGTYRGSLDGYYGKGTRSAYEQTIRSNRQLQKYSILSKHMAGPESTAPQGSLQSYIDNLWNDPQTSLDGLEKSPAAIAKAYRAYHLFVTDGPSRDVNSLMNASISEAYSTWVVAEAPHIDPSATYAYEDLDQLLKHLRYIHMVSNENVAVPCWMFRRHPGPALKAFGEAGGINARLNMQTCGGFWEWEEVRLLNAIAADLCTEGHTSEGKITSSHSELARLYLTPKSMEWKERKALMDWNENIWKGIDAWSTRDPMLAEISTALKVSYFQTQVLLEDFFMDEGFDEKDAKGLALASLKALVGHHFERFI